MTEEKLAGFMPDLWAATIQNQMGDQGAILRWYVDMERKRDAVLRVEHPWRWRVKQARRLGRRTSRAVARIVPVRWVGFGHDWTEWGDE